MLTTPLARALEGRSRDLNPGDILGQFEQPIQSIAQADANYTFTGPIFAASLITAFTGALGAGRNVQLPTADQLISAMRGGLGLKTPPDNALYGPVQATTFQWPNLLDIIPPGCTFRYLIRNVGTGQTLTVTAPATSGVSVTGTATIATNKAAMFLVRILNSAPSVTLVVSTSVAGGAANKKLTNVDRNLVNQVVPGMAAYGTGIGASAKVSAVDRDGGIIYVDTDSTATADNIAVTFTPVYDFQRLLLTDI